MSTNETSDTGRNNLTIAEAASRRHESKYILKWTIHDFSCESAKNGENLPNLKFAFKLSSSMFFEGHLTLCGENCVKRKCCLELKNTTDKYWKVCCEIKFNEDTLYTTHFTQDQTLKDFSLYDDTSCWLNEGLNIVTCEIKHVSYEQLEQPARFEIMESLQNDMEQLFESKALSDVTFLVKGQEIHAHKLILSARSKLFADMFKQSNLEDHAMSTVDIHDTEPHVFNEILRYIYTDKVLHLDKIPKRLLIASQTYGLENLKLKCEHALVPKINIENASELLILADENEAKHLKEHATNFIKNHCKAVADTLGWKDIMKNKLHLLAELYIKVIE